MLGVTDRALAATAALEASGYVLEAASASGRAAWGSDLFPVTTPYRRIVQDGASVGFLLVALGPDEPGRLVFERAGGASFATWESVYALVVDHLAPGDAFYV
jgi:hypothetical protein